MGNSLIRTRFSSSRLHSISGTTQGIDMVPNNFQIELKGLPITNSQFTGVKHVTHRETGWENSGSKETGLEYNGFIVYVHFLKLGNLELDIYIHIHIYIYHIFILYSYYLISYFVSSSRDPSKILQGPVFTLFVLSPSLSLSLSLHLSACVSKGHSCQHPVLQN